jgi:predicted transcriptional regulator
MSENMLSNHAQALLAGLFKNTKSVVSFSYEQMRPTDIARAGLDELVEKGLIAMQKNDSNPLKESYFLTKDGQEFPREKDIGWMRVYGNFKIVEQIAPLSKEITVKNEGPEPEI